MGSDVFTYLIGGKAGQGVKKAGEVAASLFSELKRYVFQMNDYQSLIRGGHNFSIVSTSTRPIYSHYGTADVIVNLDKRSLEIHRDDIKPGGLLVADDSYAGDGIGLPILSQAKKYKRPDLITGVAGVAVLAAVTGVPKDQLLEVVKREYAKGVQDNLAYAQTMYELTRERVRTPMTLPQGNAGMVTVEGNDAVAMGAAAAGLDIYLSYPMTPTTSLLHFFAFNRDALKVVAVQPENEIAVATMAIGAAFAGARSMVGTSGGGFCLMEEAFSFAGMVEAPVLFNLGQRPGPSTGLPTYSEQADLQFALTPGQGEFPRILACPGSIEEAFALAGEMLELVWRFQTPGILLTDKHLCESSMTVSLDVDKAPWVEHPASTPEVPYLRYKDTSSGVSPLLFPPSRQAIKWNSYEHTQRGLTTEESADIVLMKEKRRRKKDSLVSYLKTRPTVNTFGHGEPCIFTFGSTTMSVREAVLYGDLDVSIIQPIFLNPLPTWELEQFRGRQAISVEANSTAQLASHVSEKAGIDIQGSILRYDGRPFDPVDLSERIEQELGL